MLINLLLHSLARASHPLENKGDRGGGGGGEGIKQPLHHLTYRGFYKFICKNLQKGLGKALV